MKGKLNIYYDEEGDFLELHFGKYTRGYFREIEKGIFERIDEQTKETKGIAIIGFKRRTSKLKDINVELPKQILLTQ